MDGIQQKEASLPKGDDGLALGVGGGQAACDRAGGHSRPRPAEDRDLPVRHRRPVPEQSNLDLGRALHEGVPPGDDFQGQARGAFEAIKALVESQGGTMANVVKLTTYVTDMRYRADLAPLRAEFLGTKGPASTLVEIAALAHPDWLVEIEAIAVI